MELADYYSHMIQPKSKPENGCTLEEAYEMKLEERNAVFEPIQYDEINATIITTDYYATKKTLQTMDEKMKEQQLKLDTFNKVTTTYLEQQKQMLDYLKSVADKPSDLRDKEGIETITTPILTDDSYNCLMMQCKDLEESIHSSTLEWKQKQEEYIRILAEEMVTSNVKMQKIREFMREALVEVGQKNAEVLVSNCPVCYENKPDHCFVPCGHVFCDPCSKKFNKMCSICRKETRSVVKLYL